LKALRLVQKPVLAGGARLRHLSIDFPVTYQGKTERRDGSFCPIIWEGRPDAIMTGREELGFPKMFANIAEIQRNEDASAANCSASWFEHTFFDIELHELVELKEFEKRLPGPNGAQLYYKYFPRTSPWGKEQPDVAYATTAAPPAGKGGEAANINFDAFEFRKWVGEGSLNWRRATFEQLPLSFP
jgi:hypothetical protein